MSTHRLRSVLDHVYRVAGRPESGPDADARLLARYTGLADETAFAELVRCHGPLVLGVCRRALPNPADVDDAFQATFLVLARRAATIRRPASLPSWLHGVAWRVARKLRASVAAEPLSDALPDASADPARAAAWRELCGVLDEELHRLPERLRGPLVLCYLEGRTRDEAAVRLGYSPSTLKRRLERGRELLKVRLTRRGVTLGAALTSAALSELPAAAAVPTRLLALAASPASVSARAVQLASAVVTVSIGVKLPLAVVGVLGMALALGAGIGQRGVTPPTQPPNTPSVGAGAPAVDRFGDPLPSGALARFGTTRYRHGLITDADLSPDGKLLAAASARGVELLDLETGRPLRMLQKFELIRDPSNSASRVAFAPDGKTVAAVADNATIRVCDVATGQERRRLGTSRPNGPIVVGLKGPGQHFFDDFNYGGIRFTRDGRQLVGATGKTVHVFDLESGQLVRKLDVGGYLIGLLVPARGMNLLCCSKYLIWHE